MNSMLSVMPEMARRRLIWRWRISDVLMLDLNMPVMGGLDVLPLVRAQAPNVRVLVLTGRDENWYITQALRAGAHGYLLKSASEEDLIDGLFKVYQGHLVLGQGVAEKVVNGMLGIESPTRLTEDERAIMVLVAKGLTNEEIAARMPIPLTTLLETLAQAITKLRAKDRHAAALQAIKQGDILIDELQLK